MIFFVRHGERADHSNDQQERQKIKKEYDPHLTGKGDKMALETGAHLKKLIQEYASTKQIKMEDLTINFMTSPFLRCIQTSINLMKEIPNNSKLYIQDEIGELMYTYDFDKNILQDLHLRTHQHPIITQQYLSGVQIIKERFIKNNALPQPVFPENNQICLKRIEAFFHETVSQMNKLKNKMHVINICVTHQGVVELAIHIAGGKSQFVDFCGVAQIILSQNDNNFKIGISGESFWK